MPLKPVIAGFVNVPAGTTLPDQTGHTGEFLQTNGVTLAWAAGAGGNVWTTGSADPAGGSDGDGYLQVSATVLALWLKVSGVWTIMGYLAKSVSDTQVVFTTPTQGDLHANLSS